MSWHANEAWSTRDAARDVSLGMVDGMSHAVLLSNVVAQHTQVGGTRGLVVVRRFTFPRSKGTRSSSFGFIVRPGREGRPRDALEVVSDAVVSRCAPRGGQRGPARGEAAARRG